MKRIAVIGSPRAGKTTLAGALGAALRMPVTSSDDYISLGWSEASSHVAWCMGAASAGIFEGVAVVRSLRKLLERSKERPVEQCVVLERPLVKLSPGQETMRRACATIRQEIAPELRRRGVEMLYWRGAG